MFYFSLSHFHHQILVFLLFCYVGSFMEKVDHDHFFFGSHNLILEPLPLSQPSRASHLISLMMKVIYMPQTSFGIFSHAINFRSLHGSHCLPIKLFLVKFPIYSPQVATVFKLHLVGTRALYIFYEI